MRTAAVLLGTLLQGCIIYEESWTDTGTEPPCQRDCNDVDPDPAPDPDPGTETDEPQTSPELFLTIGEGYPGDEMLTTLESRSGQDLSDITTVNFARDVQVIDAIQRADEVVLLLRIAEDAEAGQVDCFVERSDGSAWILEEPFVVLQVSGGGTTTCATGDTGTTDTGCP